MLVIFPLAGFLLFFLIWRNTVCWRRSALLAATSWAIFSVVTTEILSLGQWLNTTGLLGVWLVLDFVLVACWLYYFQSKRVPTDPTMQATLGRDIKNINTVLVVGMLLVVLLTGVVALFAPPNNHDVMSYHLPRIVHWIQNESVSFYPTHDRRQLHMAPGAEFLMMQLHLLYGGDRLDNLIQWFALIGSALGVSLIVQQMGGSRRAEVFAALVCVTIPQGIVQASGGKNDFLLSFWLVVLAFFLLEFKHKVSFLSTFGIGAGLGLALLTKGTAFIFVPPLFLILFACPRNTFISLVKRSPLVLVLVLLLNCGYFSRNFSLYGNPIGPGVEAPTGEFAYTNAEINLSTVFSNLIRNLALHTGTPYPELTDTIENLTRRTLEVFNIDPDDPANTWSYQDFTVPDMTTHEDAAGNPLHLALLVVSLAAALVVKDLTKNRVLLLYMVGLVLGFLLFCALLKWQPWHTRLHLPLFVLGSVPIGIVLSAACPPVITKTLGVALLLISAPFVLKNDSRPLLGSRNIFAVDRVEQYFYQEQERRQPYVSAAEFISLHNWEKIGLDSVDEMPFYNLYEYPLFVLLNRGDGTTVRNVGVRNRSARIQHRYGEFTPEAVICLRCSTTLEKWQQYPGKLATVFQRIVIFADEGEFANYREYRREFLVRLSSKGRIGVFRGGNWFLDSEGNGLWDDCTGNLCINFGSPGDLPVTGDWNESGNTKIGVFRDGNWLLDFNGNGQFDDCTTDKCITFGLSGDLAVTGDWDGSGATKIGIFRDGNWALDFNGNGQFDDCTTDRCISFGLPGDIPVTGQW